MGQCQSEKSVATNSGKPIKEHGYSQHKTDKSLEESEHQTETLVDSASDQAGNHFNVMISYCWDDKILCHRIADRLMEDKFTVWIDRDRMSGDVYSAMASAIDCSDCILLCISEPYFNSSNCQKEARYASDQRKAIIPIKVKPKYQAGGWLSFIIAGKLYFRLSESENEFNMAYDKIVQEIVKFTRYRDEQKILIVLFQLKHTRRGPSKVYVKKSPKNKEDVEKRLEQYKLKSSQLIAAEKSKVEKFRIELQKLIDNKLPIVYRTDEKQLENRENDLSDEIVLPMKRWLKKYPSVTLMNIMPFTETGDINDAIFYLPDDIGHDPMKFLRSWLKRYRAFDCGVYTSNPLSKSKRIIENDPVPNKSNNERQLSKEKTDKQDEAMIYYQNLIKRIWHFDTSIPKGTDVWEKITGSIGTATWTDEEMMRRNQLDTDLTLMIDRRQQLSLYFEADINHFCLFAERMRNNIIELEEACKKQFIRKITRKT